MKAEWLTQCLLPADFPVAACTGFLADIWQMGQERNVMSCADGRCRAQVAAVGQGVSVLFINTSRMIKIRRGW